MSSIVTYLVKFGCNTSISHFLWAAGVLSPVLSATNRERARSFSCVCLSVTFSLSSPPCRGPSLCPFPFRCAGGEIVARPVGVHGSCSGLGGLEPPAEGFRGVGAAEALKRVPEEGFPCRLRHGGLRGGLVGVGGGAGEDFLEGVKHVHPRTPSCSPGPLHPAAELPQGGGRPPGEAGRGQGGEGLQTRGPGAALAGAGCGRCVSVARRTGGAVPCVGGGGRGHGTPVARVVALGGK